MRVQATLAALLLPRLLADGAPLPLDGLIRPSADGSAYAYLPPPRGGNHAASVAVLPDGALVAAWFTGGEGTPNCSIAVSRLAAGGDRWTPGAVAVTVVNQSAQNPVLWAGAGGAVRLWHTTQSPAAGESSSWIWEASSADGGVTFGRSAPFYAVAGAFTRNAVLPLGGGRLLLPCYNSTPGAIPDYPFMLISDAQRSTWHAVRAPGADLIQPTVVRLAGARLRAWLRDENQSAVFVMDSADDGESWTEPVATALPNNNAALQALVLRSGRLGLVFDAQRGPSTPRSPLVIALSDDEGLTWPVSRVLMQHDDNSSAAGEYSYPALTQTDDGLIHVCFTVDRIAIKYMRFDEEWVLQGGQRS
jgi:predicted neuraminidase